MMRSVSARAHWLPALLFLLLIAPCLAGCDIQPDKTLLISGRPVIGGNASEEAGVGFGGASSRQFNAREGGIAEEIVRSRYKTKQSWTAILEGLCRKEKNLTVVCNQFVTGADCPSPDLDFGGCRPCCETSWSNDSARPDKVYRATPCGTF